MKFCALGELAVVQLMLDVKHLEVCVLENKIFVDPLSACSLYVEPYFNDIKLSTATAFVLSYGKSYYLITNWHVISGRDADTEECLDKNLAVPNKLLVYFHKKNKLGEWIKKEIQLFSENDEPLWFEHPHKNNVDVVAIELAVEDDAVLHPISFELKDTDIVPQPGMPVSVLGFPFGLSTGGKWPIWKTGHIASDPDINYDVDKPAFLIDATTRSGMSGSPVILRTDGGFMTSTGNYVMASGITTRFLGIYAGRIHRESEVGRVWRPFLISEIIEQKLLFTAESRRQVPSRLSDCPCGKPARFKYCCGQSAYKQSR